MVSGKLGGRGKQRDKNRRRDREKGISSGSEPREDYEREGHGCPKKTKNLLGLKESDEGNSEVGGTGFAENREGLAGSLAGRC